ncbi:MAG: AMP-binding protein [Maribacter sp.]
MFTQEIHPKFCINGKNIGIHDLSEVAYSFIKEGDLFEKAIGEFLLDWIDTNETLKVHTSGSTGKPKVIELKKEQMINSALATGSYFHLKPGQTALNCLPVTYIAGKMMLVRAMVLGLDIYLVPPSAEPLSFTDRIFNFGAMVPLQADNCISKINQVKTLLIGGAPIAPDLRIALNNVKSGNYETYGMTETITHIAVKEMKPDQDNTFYALPNVTLSQDGRGCLLIDAPKVTDDRVVTNDVVDLISPKEFRWLGRFDNVINSGGVKLFPELIEQKLSAIIEVPFFIASISNEKLGEKLVLILETETDFDNLQKKLHSLQNLGPFEIPKEIFTIPKFERTESGKVQRQKTLKKALQQA